MLDHDGMLLLLFHNSMQFYIVTQMQRKICLPAFQSLAIRSQQKFAHGTTAQLSCHVQNFVMITVLKLGWEQKEISI